jgi:hypothetical protein
VFFAKRREVIVSVGFAQSGNAEEEKLFRCGAINRECHTRVFCKNIKRKQMGVRRSARITK